MWENSTWVEEGNKWNDPYREQANGTSINLDGFDTLTIRIRSAVPIQNGAHCKFKKPYLAQL
jgi:hypothetical protein